MKADGQGAKLLAKDRLWGRRGGFGIAFSNRSRAGAINEADRSSQSEGRQCLPALSGPDNSGRLAMMQLDRKRCERHTS